MGARILAFGVSLASVPLALSFLGNEQFGVWVTLTSFVALMSLVDLGIATGLLNLVAGAYGRGDEASMRRQTAAATTILAYIGAALAVVSLLAALVLPWQAILNLGSDTLAQEAGLSFMFLALAFAATLPLSTSGKLLLGIQKGYLANVFTAAGSGLTLAGIILAAQLRLSLPAFVLLVAFLPLLPQVATTALVRARYVKPLLRPLRSLGRESVRPLIRAGSLFFVLQFAMLVGYQSDSIVIAQILGPASVTDYSVALRLFMIGPTLFGFVLAALWPAYTTALAKGDVDWVSKAFRGSVLLGLAINLPLAAAFAVGGDALIALWTGEQADPPQSLLNVFAIWAALNALGAPLAIVFNAAGVLRFQIVCALTMALSNIILSIMLTQRVGVTGAMLGTVISQIGCILLPSLIFLPRFFAGLRSGDLRTV
jgi:O-antigen/teichoic acid export membrane protein